MCKMNGVLSSLAASVRRAYQIFIGACAWIRRIVGVLLVSMCDAEGPGRGRDRWLAAAQTRMLDAVIRTRWAGALARWIIVVYVSVVNPGFLRAMELVPPRWVARLGAAYREARGILPPMEGEEWITVSRVVPMGPACERGFAIHIAPRYHRVSLGPIAALARAAARGFVRVASWVSRYATHALYGRRTYVLEEVASSGAGCDKGLMDAARTPTGGNIKGFFSRYANFQKDPIEMHLVSARALESARTPTQAASGDNGSDVVDPKRAWLISRIYKIVPGDSDHRLEIASFAPSAARFLAVSYRHPRMATSLAIEVPPEMCLAGNQILSKEFVLRWLSYNAAAGAYAFDMDYSLSAVVMVGASISEVALTSAQHVVLEEGGYRVV